MWVCGSPGGSWWWFLGRVGSYIGDGRWWIVDGRYTLIVVGSGDLRWVVVGPWAVLVGRVSVLVGGRGVRLWWRVVEVFTLGAGWRWVVVEGAHWSWLVVMGSGRLFWVFFWCCVTLDRGGRCTQVVEGRDDLSCHVAGRDMSWCVVGWSWPVVGGNRWSWWVGENRPETTHETQENVHGQWIMHTWPKMQK